MRLPVGWSWRAGLLLKLLLACAVVTRIRSVAAVADHAAAAAAGLDIDAPRQPQPVIVPLRRATQAPPSIPGDQRGRLLRRQSKSRDTDSAATTQPLVSMHARSDVELGYAATLRLPGNQEVEVLPDTGSALLWLPTTMCDKCSQVILERDHPNLKAVRPVVDLKRAGAGFVNCTSEQCMGMCSPELLIMLGIKDTETFCGPHGGVCTGFAQMSDFEDIQGACTFNASYADGSEQVGALVQGPITLGGVQLQNATWGALVFGNTPRLLQPRSGGILGLQPGSCHPTGLSCAPSFLDTMAAETGLPKIVTFCGSEERPVLVFGGGDERLRQGPVLYTPIKGGGGKYIVGVESAMLGGTPLPVAADSTALVDTGSSLAFVPQDMLQAMAKALLQNPQYCGGEAPVPYLCPTEANPLTIFDAKGEAPLPWNTTDIARLPALTVTLPGGATLELRGEDYMQPIETAGDAGAGLAYYYFALQPLQRPDRFLLGQVVLRRYYVEFDVTSTRVGFAPAVPDCHRAVGL